MEAVLLAVEKKGRIRSWGQVWCLVLIQIMLQCISNVNKEAKCHPIQKWGSLMCL